MGREIFYSSRNIPMKHLHLVGIFFLCLAAMSCEPERPRDSTAVVTQTIVLPDVPSGSAIRAAGEGSFWIVSDDAPYLYRVSADGRALDSIRLTHLTTALHRIPKAEKPDYEAAVLTEVDGQPCLLAFGSGSHDTVRDSMSIVPLRGEGAQGVYSLTQFYERVRKTVGIALKDWNIEGAALQGEQLLLFNRGTGHLIALSRQEFLDEVLSRGSNPASVTAARVEIPSNDSFPPGLSGGTFLSDRRLLFCASAEATKDWYADGDVLGSYIGLLDLTEPAKPRLLSFSPLVDANGKPVKDKLEGIDLVREKSGAVSEVVGVVDNDDGTSKLLHIRVEGL